MSEKVLLVDDEKEFTEALADRMRLRDMTVSTAGSATEALRKVEDESFDAIVLDLRMPEMDGIEFLKAVRKKHPELQVIMLTGQGKIKDSVEAMKLGALDFLEKPADLDLLTEKIHDAKSRRMLIAEKQTIEKVKNILTEKGW
ncbi:MAG: two-component system response regulator [Deltaproteobacteria bacterium CG_4_8_14_3_um_filter_51_11]|nr:response regulator [bacterium]OIP41640.1 MAG: two-component system response regulator [Desulfobacteraceae bacterium CG2_30_51_40]PIP45932.1 MAG: two-component system response regulator [Deltaproteobacteria bacterium CG23_combo_of_CG06-09_8_20_14_all_51_20]PIV98886.1 MAG: two-component system response regulator [Deltaproteobacteria bacterium CG17_big_fil_post_rev_8_21_14_2_50_51_6]PIX19183.1 MAG: two-component system response regulator [Deltaproteobacteria bacterium CG_4_8_14_3_um_filter_51_1